MRWDLAMDTMLRRMVASGRTGSQIGAVMGISRNAVIGRCNRIGLKLGVGTPRENMGKAANAEKVRMRQMVLGTVPKPIPPPAPVLKAKPVPAPFAPPKLRRVEPAATPIPADGPGFRTRFLDRTAFQCAWIRDDPREEGIATRCCGLRIAPGSRSYCAEHAARAKGKAPVSDKATKAQRFGDQSRRMRAA